MLEDVALQERAERMLALLEVSALPDLQLRIRVLDDGAAAAFAWRSGDLFVTRGLLRALGDAELAAAIAHELGHLVARSQRDADADDESVADRFGQRILADSGLPVQAMSRMLSELGAHSDPGLASMLRERARRLIAEPVVDGAEIAMN